jgi:hypothetical protein
LPALPPRATVAENVQAGQQSTPVSRSSPEDPREMVERYVGTSQAERRAPETSIEITTSPEVRARSRSWVGAVSNYFASEEGTSTMPPPRTKSTQRPQTLLSSQGLFANQRDQRRPETPVEHESLFSSDCVTPDTLTTRDGIVSMPWGTNDGWTPQSLHTLSTISTPPSPRHTGHGSMIEPEIQSQLLTGSPRHKVRPYSAVLSAQRGTPRDETESKTPVSPMAPRQRVETSEPITATAGPSNRQDTGSPTEGTTTDSLFQQMRSISEQPRSSSTGAADRRSLPSSIGSQPSSGAWLADDQQLPRREPESPSPTAQPKRFSMSAFGAPTAADDQKTRGEVPFPRGAVCPPIVRIDHARARQGTAA